MYDTVSNRQVAYACPHGRRDIRLAVRCLRGSRGSRARDWKALIAGILEECEPLGLRRIALSTDDVHCPYSNLGFTALVIPETWMERIVTPGV